MVNFLNEHNLDATLPLPERHLGLYIAWLTREGLSPSSIKNALAAVAFEHKIRGFADPSRTFFISRLLKGLEKFHVKTQKAPITIDILKSVLSKVLEVASTQFDSVLFTSLFSIMYFACLRIGEVVISNHDEHTLRLKNVYIKRVSKNDVKIAIHLLTYKHSKSATFFSLPSCEDKRLCPSHNLAKFLKIRPKGSPFLFVDSDGHPLKRRQVVDLLKSCISLLGLDPNLYSSHSFRAGRASDLAERGASQEQIREMGGGEAMPT